MLTSSTCLTCKIISSDINAHKEHYKTDLHKYNLNRKISSLHPLSIDEYNERIQIQDNPSNSINENIRQKISCQHCEYGRIFLNYSCTFSSSKGLDNHMRSGKHGETMEILKTPFEIATESKMASMGISSFEQLFSDVPDALNKILAELHMQFPELVTPLSCLFCNGIFENINENLDHMVEKHSFFIPDVERVVNFGGF